MIKIKKQSKPISELKKGDRILIDGKGLIVDAHYLFMDHKTTKEMIIEVYSEKTDRDYQIRYFSGNISYVSMYNRALSQQEISQNFNALRGRFGI